jgi:hypothetical protein
MPQTPERKGMRVTGRAARFATPNPNATKHGLGNAGSWDRKLLFTLCAVCPRKSGLTLDSGITVIAGKMPRSCRRNDRPSQMLVIVAHKRRDRSYPCTCSPPAPPSGLLLFKTLPGSHAGIRWAYGSYSK